MRVLILFLFINIGLITNAQQEIVKYLSNHHYAFSLDNGFDEKTSSALIPILKNYKLILQAEGGSHYLNIYYKLPGMWIRFLNKSLGVSRAFLEFSHASAICANNYLKLGDTSLLYNSPTYKFWDQFKKIGLETDLKEQLKFFGVDFNNAKSYIKALKSLLPPLDPPEIIRNDINIIREAEFRRLNCDDIIDLNKILKASIVNNKTEYRKYLKYQFGDFEKIIMSKGTCKDVLKNRNNNIADNFLTIARENPESVFYGELGMAHTILKNKVAASIINNSEEFKGKVCVINLYCYNCSTEKEEVSNWQLDDIDKEIQRLFLPFCNSEFTLFDLSENSEVIKRYQQYGQFLIIAKNQN